MKKLITIVAVLGALAVSAPVALAQDAGGEGGGAGGGGGGGGEGGGGRQFAQTTTYSFEDDIVSGDLVRPDGDLLRVRRRGRGTSLIRVREHFIPEMLKSVENL